MTTLAQNAPRSYELGDRNEFPVVATDIIYEGAAVGLTAGDTARPLVAGDRFAGFAEATADNSAGAAGAVRVRVKEEGKIQLPVTGVVLGDAGKIVYASDDNAFTLTVSTNSKIGYVHRVVSAGVAVVKFRATEIPAA